MNVKSILISVALVVAGVLLGVALSHHCGQKHGENKCERGEQFQKDSSKCHGIMGKKDEMHKGECMMNPCMMEKKISDELALTPEQKVKVDAIFDAKRAEKEAHKKEMMAKMEKTHNDIKAILTPEQITKFDAIITEMCPTQMGGMKEGKPCCKKQTEGCQKMKE